MVRLEDFLAVHLVAGSVRVFDLQVRRAALEIKAVCCCGEKEASSLWFSR